MWLVGTHVVLSCFACRCWLNGVALLVVVIREFERRKPPIIKWAREGSHDRLRHSFWLDGWIAGEDIDFSGLIYHPAPLGTMVHSVGERVHTGALFGWKGIRTREKGDREPLWKIVI